MNFLDLIEETYFSLASNKTRSFLTALGIVIGIGSVISMISIGEGSQKSIQSNIQNLGSNLIIVMPGAQRGVGGQVNQGRGSAQTLSIQDSESLSSIEMIEGIAPESSGRYQVTAKGTNTNTTVLGTSESYSEIRKVAISEGSFFSSAQIKNLAKVVVLGANVKEDLFGADSSPIGKKIKIKGMEFTVIGIAALKGGNGFGSSDDMVFAPISTVQQYLTGNQRVSSINIQVKDQKSMAPVQQEITVLLMERHNISDQTSADFSVVNQGDIVEAASSVANTFTILLASVAAISLVVGGIGIMNMMLTTIMERIREIGLRKAIGASKNNIVFQFLAEAIALTFFGGVLGIFTGFMISLAVSKFGGIPTQISLMSVLLAFGVSALIGFVFGYYPARKAANLDPIESLKYE